MCTASACSVQIMSILVVNQSVIDMLASTFAVASFAYAMDMKGLNRDSISDQLFCRFWLTKRPLWCMLITSTYGILIMTLSRYVAVIYPLRYKQVGLSIDYCVHFCN